MSRVSKYERAMAREIVLSMRAAWIERESFRLVLFMAIVRMVACTGVLDALRHAAHFADLKNFIFQEQPFAMSG